MGVSKNWSRKCHTSTTNCVSFGQGQVYIYCSLTYCSSISFVTHNMCKVDDLDDQEESNMCNVDEELDFEDMENDDDTVEDKDVTDVDTDNLDF